MTTNLYTTSRLRVFRECNRKHLFRYVLGIQTPGTPAMQFGTAAHKALEAWYVAWQKGVDRLPAALAEIESSALDDLDRARLRVLIVAYDARWSAEDWEVIGVELEFRYFLGDAEIGGKIDALIRERATGKIYVVEHKTSTADTSAGAPYWDRLAVDTQVSIYVDGAATHLDSEIAGCIYDVLKRPLHELKLATPEDKRDFTKGKGCKPCGGTHGGKGGVKQGSGVWRANENDAGIPCADCNGSGWFEAPRLDARQRETDENLEEFEDRLATEIAERVDDFLARGVVVRLEHELPRMRQELLDTISAMELLADSNLAPPNHDACIRGRETCFFFAACAGRASIDDESIYPRGAAHPELAAQDTAAVAA